MTVHLIFEKPCECNDGGIGIPIKAFLDKDEAKKHLLSLEKEWWAKYPLLSSHVNIYEFKGNLVDTINKIFPDNKMEPGDDLYRISDPDNLSDKEVEELMRNVISSYGIAEIQVEA